MPLYFILLTLPVGPHFRPSFFFFNSDFFIRVNAFHFGPQTNFLASIFFFILVFFLHCYLTIQSAVHFDNDNTYICSRHNFELKIRVPLKFQI